MAKNVDLRRIYPRGSGIKSRGTFIGGAPVMKNMVQRWKLQAVCLSATGKKGGQVQILDYFVISIPHMDMDFILHMLYFIV